MSKQTYTTTTPKRVNRLMSTLDLESTLEEYMSKLEQRVMLQTLQLQAITDNAASCLFMLDGKGRPTFMNPAAQMATGYLLNEIRDQPLLKTIHDSTHAGLPYQPEDCHFINISQLGDSVHAQEEVFKRKDGSGFYASFSVNPFQQSDGQVGSVLEFQDITKRKEMERERDDFIGVASHELKTPVTSMKIYTQALMRQFSKQGDAKSALSLSKIDAQINRLVILINDLLDTTRVQTGNLSMRLEKFALDELIVDVVETMQLTTDAHHLNVITLPSMMIEADRDRVNQVLTNLLSNAIKYSPNGGEIVIKAEAKRGQVIVSVKDCGIGIPADKQSQVFERFMRVSKSQASAMPGLGIGLFISYQIVTRLGGRIWLESAEGHGSTFYFCLPLKQKK